MIARAAAGRIHYAWIVAAITFLALLCAAGFRSTPGVLMVPLQHEYGWSRATISIAVSINLVLYGFSGPFAAALMQRFGTRLVMVSALFAIGVGAGLTTRMTEPWQLDLLWGVVVGLASGTMASVLAATVANRWFVRRRGIIMGVLTASGATGQIQFLPILALLTASLGWRSAAWAVAVVSFALIPLVVLLMQNAPEDIGLSAYGAREYEVSPAPTGNPIGNALRGLRLGSRSRDFWLLSVSFFVCGASTNGLIGTHLIPAAMDHGMSEVAAATLLATMGAFDIVGTIFSGWLTDRLDSRWLLAWYYALRGLSLFLLPYALGSPNLALIVFVVFYGLDWVATVPPTAAIATEVFGRADGSIVFGWIFASHQLGAATAAFAAGAIRTQVGSYLPAFLAAGTLCLIASALVTRLPSTSVRTRRESLAAEPEPQPVG